MWKNGGSQDIYLQGKIAGNGKSKDLGLTIFKRSASEAESAASSKGSSVGAEADQGSRSFGGWGNLYGRVGSRVALESNKSGLRGHMLLAGGDTSMGIKRDTWRTTSIH